MNRWRQRLAELQRTECGGRSHASSHPGQNVQNGQKCPTERSELGSGHFGQSVHDTESTEPITQPIPPASWSEAKAATTVIAPGRWFERDPARDEPPYDEPFLARCGVIRRWRGQFEHFCADCGRWGAFGYGAIGEQPGRWYCFRHRPDNEP
jgi:hypothetical protein